MFEYYRNKYGHKGDFPVAENMGRNTLSLPLAAHVTDDDAHRIGSSLNPYY